MVSLYFGILSVQTGVSQPALQSGKLIPVYPGAELKTDLEPGDSKICCSFVTNDSFDQVVSLYENSLELKPLDPNGLATQIPFLKPQVDEMLKQMPAGMKIRFFVLHVVEFQGQPGAEIFEAASSQKSLEFDISPSQFTGADSHFEADFEGNETGEEIEAWNNIISLFQPSKYICR